MKNRGNIYSKLVRSLKRFAEIMRKERLYEKTIVIVYDGAVINGGAAKIAIQSAVELAKNPDINMIYFAANAEVDECLQSNDAIKVVCIDTPHIASNKNKIKASLYGIWNRKAKQNLQNCYWI